MAACASGPVDPTGRPIEALPGLLELAKGHAPFGIELGQPVPPELLRELPQSMIVASHDLPMVRELLPRTVVMDHGLVAADGPTAQVLSDPILLREHGLEM